MMMTLGGTAVTGEGLDAASALLNAILADPKAVQNAIDALRQATLQHNVAQAAAAKQAEETQALLVQANAEALKIEEREDAVAQLERQQETVAAQLAAARAAIDDGNKQLKDGIEAARKDQAKAKADQLLALKQAGQALDQREKAVTVRERKVAASEAALSAASEQLAKAEAAHAAKLAALKAITG